MIRTSSTRLQRARVFAIAPLFALLTSSACAGPTVNLRPQVEQRPVVGLTRAPRPEATTQDGNLETLGPSAREATQPCAQSFAFGSLATPEAAVRLYVESIAANHFACALRAYAAHEHAARFDFTAVARWTHIMTPAVLKAPAEYPMFVELNEFRAKGEMAQATKLFVYDLLADRDPTDGQVVESDLQIQAFVQAVNPVRLAALRVVRIDQPRQSVTNGPEGQALFKKLATLASADEMAERIALYELSGQFLWSGFRLCRYDKTWKIYEFASTFAGRSGKTTTAEYEARLQ